MNFSWVDPGKLAASGRPGGMFGQDTGLRDLVALKQQGIRLVVSLTEDPLDPEALAAAGIEGLHLPTPDMAPPSARTIDVFLDAVESAAARQEATLVHCRAGLGRTGTLVACYFVCQGLSPSAAIDRVRALRPGSIETTGQEDVVHAFAARYNSGMRR